MYKRIKKIAEWIREEIKFQKYLDKKYPFRFDNLPREIKEKSIKYG